MKLAGNGRKGENRVWQITTRGDKSDLPIKMVTTMFESREGCVMHMSNGGCLFDKSGFARVATRHM